MRKESEMSEETVARVTLRELHCGYEYKAFSPTGFGEAGVASDMEELARCVGRATESLIRTFGCGVVIEWVET